MSGIPNVPLTKESISNNCIEKRKAFESAWCELKEKGYIVQYLQPKKNGRGWYQEYEILEVPRKDGIHTIYRNKEGEETGKTNLNRDRYPHKGIYGQGSNGDGIYGKGGNKRYINNISLNTDINNIAGNQKKIVNSFNNFKQNEYDFDRLEQELLETISD